MSPQRLVLVGWIWAVTSIAAPLAAQELSREGKETSSKPVKMEELPEAARQTLLQHAGQNPIRELEQKVVDGQTLYEMEIRPQGKEVEVVVAPDGKLVRIKKGKEGELPLVASLSGNKDRRKSFKVDRQNLVPVSHNPYFPLTPGLKLTLSDGSERVVVSVLDQTRVVDGVETRVVEEYETKDGVLVEISRNFFAVDKVKGDVYYFGEEVDIYENGKVVSTEGAWLAGVDGGKMGLIMPGRPQVGDRFYLEMAPGAVESVKIASTDAALETPARKFTGVVHAHELNELDGGTSEKWYAPGLGMVGDDAMRLVKVELAVP